MRVLIIADQFPPIHYGGMSQHAWHISGYLATKHNVQVLLPMSCEVVSGAVPFKIIPRLTMRFPRVDAYRALTHASKFKPDVIHVCTAGLAFPLLTKRYPVVTRVVGNDFLRPWCGGSFLLRSLYFRIPNAKFRENVARSETAMRQRKVIEQLNNCSLVVANTGWTKERLTEKGVDPKSIKVITGGCDTNIFEPLIDKTDVRQRLGFRSDETILLVASNLVSDKALDVMLHAISRLVKKYFLLRYIVVGTGPEESKLKALVEKLGINSNVSFVGHKTQQELKSYYQASDIYVQASRVETMGRTYMEAGACGIPVVASRVGGVPSVVEDGKNGLLINNPESVDELVETIEIVLQQPKLRSSMGAEGVRLANGKFSWEKIGLEFENLMVNSYKKAACK